MHRDRFEISVGRAILAELDDRRHFQKLREGVRIVDRVFQWVLGDAKSEGSPIAPVETDWAWAQGNVFGQSPWTHGRAFVHALQMARQVAHQVASDAVIRFCSRKTPLRTVWEFGTEEAFWDRTIRRRVYRSICALRRSSRQIQFDNYLLRAFESRYDAPDMQLAKEEVAERLRAISERLPDRERTAIEMANQAATLKEIAEALGVQKSQAGLYLARARQRIRAIFGDKE